MAAAGARAIGCALTPEITSFRRREWNPLPYEGCVGVDGKVVVHEDDLLVAMLRFGENATIHEHPGETETIVACIEGEGLTSVAGETAPIREGELVRWPKGIPHRLWTEDSRMKTLMIERATV